MKDIILEKNAFSTIFYCHLATFFTTHNDVITHNEKKWDNSPPYSLCHNIVFGQCVKVN